MIAGGISIPLFSILAQPQEAEKKLEAFSRDVGIGQGVGGLDYQAGSIINSVLSLVGLIFLIVVIYAGFQWQTAGGNEEKAQASLKMFISAILGLVIVLGAYIFVNSLLGGLIGAVTGTP